MKNFTDLSEKATGSAAVFDGIILHVNRDTVTLPNGSAAVREVIRHIGAVGILPLTDDGKVIVERQYRYPVDAVITEIPAGKLDRPDEDRLEAAKRELREETGITAGEWTCLGDILPAAAYCDERLTLFLAKDLRFGEQDLDADEFLNVEAVPLEELVREVMDGTITDSKTQVGLLKLWKLQNG